MREGSLRVIRGEEHVVKEMKEESRGKKVDQFCECSVVNKTA